MQIFKKQGYPKKIKIKKIKNRGSHSLIGQNKLSQRLYQETKKVIVIKGAVHQEDAFGPLYLQVSHLQTWSADCFH